MGEKDQKRKRPGSGASPSKEIHPLNEKREAILKLEELEERLEMQRMPLEPLDECAVQAEGCYTDTCDNFCDHCVYNVGCEDHCYCYGEWCVGVCVPHCISYCLLCTDDGHSTY